MKRTLATLTLACALVLAAIAAPALSLRPYRAEPVDFELDAPGGPAVRGAAASAYVSPVLRAPRRFNLAGLRWSGRATPRIAVRVRQSGGRWSRWTPVAGHADGAPDAGVNEPAGRSLSSPLWAGEADEIQYRLSRPVARLRLYFVNTTGSTTRLARVRTEVRAAASSALVALASLDPARAQTPAPAIVPRSAWGAADCAPREPADYGEVKAAIVHHTVTANDYTPAQAPAAVLAICRYHRNANRWNDVGYNFLVDKYGTVYEGRAGGVDRAVVGAQAQGYNAQTTGIANIGTHSALPQNDVALDSIARLIRWKLPLHGQPTAGTVPVTSAGGASNRFGRGREVTLERISGHRDGNSTSCPGDALYAQLPSLRARVGGVAPVTPRTRIDATVGPGIVRFPQQARLSGTLRRLTGAGVSGAPVEVQAFAGRAGWRTVARTTSSADGAFEALLSPPAKRVLRARFAGGQGLLGSTSRQGVVLVRPVLTTTRSVSRARVGRTPVIAGRIGPAKKRVLVVVERRIGGRNRRVARVLVRARGGRFRTAFRLRRPGLFRFSAVFAGDTANLAASGAPVYVRALGTAGGAASRR